MDRLAKKLETIGNDPKVAARSVGLRYCGHSNKGYFRKKLGSSFFYVDEFENRVTCPELLDRFKKLVIPPAWTDVWISPYENGHLQVTGVDARGRRQYRYHQQWTQIRNQHKFYRLRAFADALPGIRKKLDADLKRRGLPYEKVMALVVRLMELTHIRIGNDAYQKLYGSFGMTTLRDKHVSIKSTSITFEFTGKKGIAHKIKLQSPRLARLVRRCKEIPGQELFQYYDENGCRRTIGSADVNNYLKECTGQDFTAKDFRAWAGTVHTLCAFREVGDFASEAECRRNIVKVIDSVAEKLGNTRSVCKKYYIHPTVMAAYTNQALAKYLVRGSKKSGGLSPDERTLVKILDNEKMAPVLI